MKNIILNNKLFLFIFVIPFILFFGQFFIPYSAAALIYLIVILVSIIEFIFPFSDKLFSCSEVGCSPTSQLGWLLIFLLHLIFSFIIPKFLGAFVKFTQRIHNKIPIKYQSTFSWNHIFKFIIFVISLIIGSFSSYFLFSHNTNVKVLDYEKAYVDCGNKKLFIKDYLSNDVAFESITDNTKKYIKYICSSFYSDISFDEYVKNFSDNYTFYNEDNTLSTGTIKCKYNNREYKINYYPYGSERYYKGLYDCSDMKDRASYDELVSTYKLQPRYYNIQKWNMDRKWILLSTFFGIFIVVVINIISYLVLKKK